MGTRRTSLLAPNALLLAACLAVSGCSGARQAGGFLAGEAKVSQRQASADAGPPPSAIYVAPFTVAPGAVKSPGGLFGAAEQLVDERPRVLGGGLLGGGAGGGILARRTAADHPSGEQVSATLARAIVEGLEAERLGIPAVALPQDASPPASGWLVRGRFDEIDPGNRAQRAVVGFGAGEATVEVTAQLDRLDGGAATTLLDLGSTSDSGHAPGAAVTLNPYAAAAKFVLGRDATQRDVERIGQSIAQEIARYAHAHGVAPPAP